MICKNCNQIIDDEAKFCPNCGTPQNAQTEQQHLTQDQLIQQARQQQSIQEQPIHQEPVQQQEPSSAPQQSFTQQSPPPRDGQGQASQVYYYQQENQDHSYQSDNTSQYNTSGYNEEMISSAPYLIFAIITTILCCLPLGIPAIMFAAKISSAQREGAMDVAKIYARKAKMFTICSAALGVVLWTCFIGIMVIGSVAGYYQY